MMRLISVLMAAMLIIPLAAAAAPQGPREWGAHPPIHVNRHKPGGGGGGGTPPPGYNPSQIRHAYGFDLVGSGSGRIIAIVDAYDDPTAASDLATFRSQFGITSTLHGLTSGDPCTVAAGPHPCFQKATPQGLPQANGGWALEVSLDTQWAHAMAQGADILLVEAASNSLTNLLGAVTYAVSAGAVVVSMSWGGSDISGYDSYFQASGVMFVASSGDSGSGVEFPANSPYVVSVGGTSLSLDSSGNVLGETAWSGSGGGTSSVVPEPTFQSNFGISSNGKRGNPDVSYVANPSTGVAVYDSTPYNGQTGWFEVGGTSAGSPQWAAIFAISAATKGSGVTTTLSSSPVYNATIGGYSTMYRDITSGSNGGFSAGTGWDFVTGLGSPKVSQLVNFWLTH